jgi:hypothetical protein
VPAVSLRVGPLLRYTDETRATVWVETEGPGEVDVRVAGRSHTARTWSVHGHHFALVRIEDLTPASTNEYSVHVDDQQVWPLADSAFPPSVIRTADPDAPFRLAFGSCRRSAPFDEEHLDALGADALVALAARMGQQPTTEWPDALLMLGDQVYADDPSEHIVERLHERHRAQGRDVDREVDGEILDFEEYTWLYQEAWMEPSVRWLLSTVPTGMMLDDHDLRDDWNTSKSWREWVTQQDWWPERVIGAYGSYWVYQHLGNLSPAELDGEPVYAQMQALATDEERTKFLDDFAWQVDQDASSTRFSFYRDLGVEGRGVRVVAIDSRCSRQLDPDDRRMVDPQEWAWVRDRVLDRSTGWDHLVLCSTLPFLLLPGIHHLEGWNEAVAQGGWGRLPARFGEWFRQFLDLEHWAAFRESFAELTDLLAESLAAEERPPATVLMLSGDVHCSYTARAALVGRDHPDTEIHQLTMSPFRNDIERPAKTGFRLLNRRRSAAVVHRLARWAKVEDVDITWQLEHGPWFDNAVMVVTFAGSSASVEVLTAQVGADGRQVLRSALVHELRSGPVATADQVATADD